MNATIYCRISLDRSGEMLGVERQETECRAYCERQGWAIREVIVDNDISATSGKVRPGFERLLTSRPEVVVVWHTDRLVRLSKELERVIDLGVNIFALHAGHLDLSNPAGRAVAKTVTAWAQYEGEQKSLRQKASHVQRAKAGKPWWTKRPFGYNMDGTLREDEAALIEVAYRDFIGRTATLTEIARRWNAAGILTTESNEWNQSKVHQLLRSPRNASVRVQHKIVVGPGNWDPIVADETLAAAVVIMSEPSRKRGALSGARKGLLVGIARCGKCGSTVRQGANRRTKDGFYPRVYACIEGCTSHPVEDVNDYVGAAMVEILRQPQISALMPESEEAEDLIAQRATLEINMKGLGEDYADGLINREEFRTLRSRQNERLAELEAEIGRSLSGTVLRDLPLGYLAENWFVEGKVTDTQKRQAISGLLRIQLLPRQKGARYYDPTESIELSHLG